jgi:diguanylate cyclase (GGDEF)-like protein
MRRLFAILALSVAACLGMPAHASDLLASSTVLVDPTGTLTIADVAGRVTAPAGSSVGVSSSRNVYWLCFRVRHPASGSQVVLVVRPAYLNDVRIYEAGPGDPLTWKTRVTGNHYPYGVRDRASTTLGFVVDVTGAEGTYYLRVKSRSLASIAVEALEPPEAERRDHDRDLLMMFFITAMLCLLLWAILNYLLNRRSVVGLFGIHQTVYTLFAVATTGYLAPLVPARFPQLADWVNIVLYCAINFTSILFCRALFKPYGPPLLPMRGLSLLLGTFPVLLTAIALGYDSPAVIANSAIIKVTWLLFVVIAFSLRAESTPSRRLLQAFFVCILLNNLAFWVAGRSTQFASVVNLPAIQLLIVDGLIIGGLFAMILHTRARQAMREAHQSAVDLILVQKKLELEQELKKQAELQAQTDYLTGLFNRRRFVESAEHELERAIRYQRPLTLLMIDIDHFKAVNDTRGHAIGDIVLQNVSILIRDALRSVDILGRMGGEEFAATIVETEGSDACEIAQRVCAAVAGAAIDPAGTGKTQVTVSIGLAQLKGRKIGFNDLLDEADRAMYNAKQAGRNRLAVFA